jgi:hypothetical protein
MVHGDCSSRGCYAMTDEQMGEIFALGRESFAGGQKSFQVQAYPFRMTALNMAKHRNSPHMDFWRMLKVGYDHFEVTRQEPKIDVCEKRYVFNAQSPNGGPVNFSARNRCPAYQVDPQIASLIQQKQADDDQQFTAYAARNVPTAPIRTGADGGMHPTFIAKLKPKKLMDGVFNSEPKIAGAQPGAISLDRINLPKNVDLGDTVASVPGDDAGASSAKDQSNQTPVVTPAASSEPVAAPAKSSQPSAFQRVGQLLGFRSKDASEDQPPPPTKPAAVAATPAPSKPKPAPQPKQVAQVPAPSATAAVAPPAAIPATPAVMNGATAPVSTSSFDSRFGSTR